MSSSSGPPAQPYATNYTYIYEYSRGLNGVDVPLDNLITQTICASLGLVAVTVFLSRVLEICNAYIRHISCLSASRRQQHFWSLEGYSVWPKIKKHIIHSPLFRKRHHREFQLSSAINMGVLPSRLHAILLVLYLASQVAYCSILDYAVNEKAALVAELRGRAGTLAVLNMIPLFLFAGRNNLLIWLLGVSFDTYNLFHRWLGRIVVLEAVVHTIAWFVNASAEQSFAAAIDRIRNTPFFTYGALATVAMIFLIIHSPSPIRHAFYETFLHLHQLAAVLALVGVYFHLRLDALPQSPWIYLILGIWIFERTMRWILRFHLNVSLRNGTTVVVVKALPGEACRVTFHLPRRVHVKPGSHVYAFIPTVAWWMSHPFSVAWVDPSSCVTPPSHPIAALKGTVDPYEIFAYTPSCLEKQDPFLHNVSHISSSNIPTPTKPQKTSISLVMAARSGMTRKLYAKAWACPNHTLRTFGFVEGPYNSGNCAMGSYGTAILFSGGAGITHHLLHVRDLLVRADDGCVATQRIYLIWSVRSIEALNWIREWMDQILQLPNRRQILTIKLFVSKPKMQIKSPSENVQMFAGRCNPSVVLDEALPKRIGATVVSVCGPGAFADEVRVATRDNIDKGMSVDFVEEAFSW
ncbi:metalloreductase [Talaromyces proteolyticus]|uniref:Metalloreductase n=1 Tax=Talaromyces proteolyticus TaxID=1131652 RepID=A0AAD4KRU9_9EURO|nr:metalloreductase [Talaromyces proteolyticus]KAH8699005.1 metalloreductase [Talaromyces proteolyticus]